MCFVRAFWKIILSRCLSLGSASFNFVMYRSIPLAYREIELGMWHFSSGLHIRCEVAGNCTNQSNNWLLHIRRTSFSVGSGRNREIEIYYFTSVIPSSRHDTSLWQIEQQVGVGSSPWALCRRTQHLHGCNALASLPFREELSLQRFSKDGVFLLIILMYCLISGELHLTWKLSYKLVPGFGECGQSFFLFFALVGCSMGYSIFNYLVSVVIS